ncbi:hypothetical protein AGMMS49944_17410 [Spirochaetia bacterium]|nr:hypothetical protein AGMMS49944_17410 [Spirochaetia bacterium]
MINWFVIMRKSKNKTSSTNLHKKGSFREKTNPEKLLKQNTNHYRKSETDKKSNTSKNFKDNNGYRFYTI